MCIRDRCYTIETTSGNTVTNPNGTLYMSANSASGSKFYELISAQQDYIAQRSQNWLPSYSVITMTPKMCIRDRPYTGTLVNSMGMPASFMARWSTSKTLSPAVKETVAE